MAKGHRNDSRSADQLPRHYPPPRQGADALALATLAGVVAVLVISFANWREIDRIEEGLDDRMSRIETRLVEVSGKVERLPTQAAPAAQPARRGPDPNRVYEIKTAGAPVKGPASAPVTIAEFSDFQ